MHGSLANKWPFFQIELEEYGEALALAQSYNLDCDLVYQKQWRKSPVTVSSIHDYLVRTPRVLYYPHLSVFCQELLFSPEIYD